MSRGELGGYWVLPWLFSSLACGRAPETELMALSSAGGANASGNAAGAFGSVPVRSGGGMTAATNPEAARGGASPVGGSSGASLDAVSPGDAGSGGAGSGGVGSSDAGSGGAASSGGGAGAPVSAGSAPVSQQAASGRSSGCGTSRTGSGAFEERSLSISGTSRTYHVMVPKTYDGNRAYPLVFRFHGTGGDGTSGGLGIEFASKEDAIVVGPNGLDARWSSQNEENDLAFFDAMLSVLESEYCTDEARVFAYGFSAGGGFTNLLGCERSEVIRATAAIASYDRGESCDGGVAAWFHHDASDQSVPIERGRAARDDVLTRNGCSSETTPEGERCVRYQGCNPETPVVWCESSGQGHNIAADFAPNAVWSFFTSLP